MLKAKAWADAQLALDTHRQVCGHRDCAYGITRCADAVVLDEARHAADHAYRVAKSEAEAT